MRILSALSLALPLVLGSAAGAAAASDEESAAAYARDNTVFTLFHEFGHLFVDQFDLPVLSREEDAVDNLATLMAIEEYETSEDGGVLGNAVYGWELAIGEDGNAAPDAATLYDSHSLTRQRAFTMLCLMVGRDRDRFGAAATEWGMDRDRQENCEGDYEQAAASWDRVLAEHRATEGGQASAPIRIVYEDTSRRYADARAILEDSKLLESFARRMETEFVIPEGVTLKATECGQANAFYDSTNVTIEVCYELVDYYVGQYMNAPGGVGDDGSDDGVPVASDDGIAIAQPVGNGTARNGGIATALSVNGVNNFRREDAENGRAADK